MLRLPETCKNSIYFYLIFVYKRKAACFVSAYYFFPLVELRFLVRPLLKLFPLGHLGPSRKMLR